MELFGYRLGDLFTRFSSGKNLTEDRITKDEKYPVYGGNGLRGYTDAFNFEGECILIGRQGAKCGNVRYFHGKGYMTDHAIVGVCTENHSAKFLSLALAGLNLNRLSGQAAQPGLAVGMLKKQMILLPTKEHQDRIAEIISAYDDLIENNNKRIKILEQMAEELYKEWFVRFRFPGYEATKFDDGLPVGWERKRLSDYYNTCSGGTPSRSNERYYSNGSIPWVKTGEICDSIIIDTEEHITEEAIEKSSAKKLPAGSVLMAMYGVNIGKLAYIDTEMSCNQACCVFEDKKNHSSCHYLFHFLRSIREYLILISFGAAQQNLSQDVIRRIKVVMPAKSIIESFESQLELIYKETLFLRKKNQILVCQRNLLLPRLMSGKLEV